MAVLAALVVPPPTTAQTLCRPPQQCRPAPEPDTGPSDTRMEVTGLAMNALLGGLTTGIPAAIRGEPVARAFVAGAVGGALVYGGKRVAVERFAGAGLLGRELGAVGGSVVRNVARGDAAASLITLPLGPLRFDVGRGRPVRARLDLATLVAAGVFIVQEDGRFEPGHSLSAGALVFRSPSRRVGMHAAGVVLVPDPGSLSYDQPTMLAHERVHVLQYDQAHLSWGGPAERWMLRGSGAGRWLNQRVDLGLTAVAGSLLNVVIDYGARPWEHEADRLADLGAPPP